jgi:hypothetical protein
MFSGVCPRVRWIHHDGWLTTEQIKFIDFHHPTLPKYNLHPIRQLNPVLLYEPNSLNVPTILQAFNEADIVIKDMRFSNGEYPLYVYNQCHLLPAFLSTLHIALNIHCLKETRDCFKIMAGMRGLEDLAPTVNPRDTELSFDENPVDYNCLTTEMFKAIVDSTILRCVTFAGNWGFTETDIVDFVKHHASSLRYLMLYDCIVNGDWFKVLHGIAEITHNHLEDLGVIFPRFIDEDGIIDNERFKNHFVSEWPHLHLQDIYRSRPSPSARPCLRGIK